MGYAGVSLERGAEGGRRTLGAASFGVPRPHPAFVILVIAAEPGRASGRFAVCSFARKVLQTDDAGFAGVGVSIGKSSTASTEVAADRPVGFAIAIGLIGRHAPVTRMVRA